MTDRKLCCHLTLPINEQASLSRYDALYLDKRDRRDGNSGR